MKKEKILALSVTTLEALTASVREKYPAICIEKPLYPGIKESLDRIPGIFVYKIIEYERISCIMLVRNNTSFEIDYFRFRGL